MKAMNRTNAIGITYCFIELTNGDTRIHLLNKPEKRITVKARIEVLDQSWFNWQNGALVQNAFPYLDASEREFIKTAITPDEWDELFSGHEV